MRESTENPRFPSQRATYTETDSCHDVIMNHHCLIHIMFYSNLNLLVTGTAALIKVLDFAASKFVINNFGVSNIPCILTYNNTMIYRCNAPWNPVMSFGIQYV